MMILEITGEAILRNCPDELIDRITATLRIESPEVDVARRLLRQAGVSQGEAVEYMDAEEHMDFGSIYKGIRRTVKDRIERGMMRPMSRTKIHSYIQRVTASVTKARGESRYLDLSVPVDGGVSFPRALAARMKRICEEVGALEIRDKRDPGEVLACESKIKLRDYQKEPVGLAVRRNGLIVAPCGSGKTVMAAEAIARLGRWAIVVVHQIEHAEQWAAEITGLLGVETGVVGDGRREWAPITLALPKTLGRLDVPRGYGVLVVDEVHHIPAETCREAAGACRAYRRIGLTATLERKDGLTPVIKWIMGPVIAEVTHSRLYDDGYLMRCVVKKAHISDITAAEEEEIGVDPTEEPSLYLSKLVSLPRRRQEVVEVIADTLPGRAAALALCGRVPQCEALARDLRAAGISAAAAHGKTSKKDRSEALRRLDEGDLRVLCAVNIADENLNITRLDTAYLCAPFRAARKAIQRIGRTMRPMCGKNQPEIYDILDGQKIGTMPGVLKSQWRSRRRAYLDIEAKICTYKKQS